MAPSPPRRENDGTGAPGGPGTGGRDGSPLPVVGDDVADLERALAAVAAGAEKDVGSCDGLGVTVQLGPHLVFGQSNSFTRTVDAVQYGLMEGPCLLAQTSGFQVRSAEIGAGEQRWPRFTRQAAEVGLRSVVSAPLLAADGPIGSLNVYGATARSFSDLRPDALASVAGQVTEALRSPVLTARSRANARWFALAVQDRADVDRAVGVLMDRYRLTRAEAQVLVQQLAHEDGVSEIVAARTVIDQDGA